MSQMNDKPRRKIVRNGIHKPDEGQNEQENRLEWYS